jgi:CheY-like chemotaxis protein
MPDYALKKFLIVEDFQSFRGIMKEMLRDMGAVHIDEATNSSEAIHYCEEQTYDVILADFDLGKGMNGQQLLETLRQRALFKRTSLYVMSSAEMSKEQVLMALESEPDAYLAKPFTPSLFKKRLRNISVRHEAMFDIFSAIDREDYEGAISLCEKQILFGSHYAHHCKKIQGELFFKLKQYDDAKRIYQHINADRQFDWALLGLGKVNLAVEAYDEALKNLTTLTSAFPLSLQGYDTMAQTYMAMDNSELAQEVLDRALNISSVSAPRQRFMGEVCWYNRDYERAVKAFKKSVRLARHSIYERPENELDLARCMVDFASQSPIKKAEDLNKEVFALLTDVVRKYKTDPVKLQSKLIESRGFCVLKEIEAAEKSLAEAKVLIKAAGENVAPDIQLEMAKTYIDNQCIKEAQVVLTDVAKKYSSNKELVRKVDRLSSEPVSDAGKQKVNDMNRRGAQFYKQKNYLAAINEFSRAEKMFPNHIGLKLNIFQAMVGELENKGENAAYQLRCEQYLKELDGMDNQHRHFERFNSLVRKYAMKPWLSTKK